MFDTELMDDLLEEFLELLDGFYGGNTAKVMENAWSIAKAQDEESRDPQEVLEALGRLTAVANILKKEVEKFSPEG